jgi:hypothetical protein
MFDYQPTTSIQFAAAVQFCEINLAAPSGITCRLRLATYDHIHLAAASN